MPPIEASAHGGEGIDDQFQAERTAVECVKPRFCRATKAEAQDVGHDRHAQLDCPENSNALLVIAIKRSKLPTFLPETVTV